MNFRGRRSSAEVVGAFLASRWALNCRPATVRRYEYTLGRFVGAFPRLPERPEPLETWLGGLSVGPVTRDAFRRDLRALYRWAGGRLGVRGRALEALRGRRLPRHQPRALTDHQLDELLGLDLSRRDRALVELFLDSGLRVGELAGLRWSDVGSAELMVEGKTGRRRVPVSPAMRRRLIGVGDGEHLWLGGRGPLTVEGVKQVVRRALGRVGVVGGPHRLRHTFATFYLRAGGDVVRLQRILGHRELATTLVYVDLVFEDVRAEHARLSPIALRAAAGRG